jgi:hypothetical protein
VSTISDLKAAATLREANEALLAALHATCAESASLKAFHSQMDSALQSLDPSVAEQFRESIDLKLGTQGTAVTTPTAEVLRKALGSVAALRASVLSVASPEALGPELARHDSLVAVLQGMLQAGR